MGITDRELEYDCTVEDADHNLVNLYRFSIFKLPIPAGASRLLVLALLNAFSHSSRVRATLANGGVREGHVILTTSMKRPNPGWAYISIDGVELLNLLEVVRLEKMLFEVGQTWDTIYTTME